MTLVADCHTSCRSALWRGDDHRRAGGRAHQPLLGGLSLARRQVRGRRPRRAAFDPGRSAPVSVRTIPAGEVEHLVAARAETGEGPLWDDREQVLWWVDIPSRALHRYDPATGRDTVRELSQMAGAVALREAGGLVLAVQEGFAEFGRAGSGADRGGRVRPARHAHERRVLRLPRPVLGGTMSLGRRGPFGGSLSPGPRSPGHDRARRRRHLQRNRLEPRWSHHVLHRLLPADDRRVRRGAGVGPAEQPPHAGPVHTRGRPRRRPGGGCRRSPLGRALGRLGGAPVHRSG